MIERTQRGDFILAIFDEEVTKIGAKLEPSYLAKSLIYDLVENILGNFACNALKPL